MHVTAVLVRSATWLHHRTGGLNDDIYCSHSQRLKSEIKMASGLVPREGWLRMETSVPDLSCWLVSDWLLPPESSLLYISMSTFLPSSSKIFMYLLVCNKKFSCSTWDLSLRHTGLLHACGILAHDQRSNLCPLHYMAPSKHWASREVPRLILLYKNICWYWIRAHPNNLIF